MAGVLLSSCGSTGNGTAVGGDPLAKCAVIGKIEQVGDNKVMSADQRLMKDSIRMPLSFLAEEMEIIPLDNREEALVPTLGVIPSDNYLLTMGQKQVPFKLFDRKGNFIAHIGSYGQGPGEYLNVYDAQLDEAHDRIYILPWQSDKLLVYDLKGNSLPPIQLCMRTPKAKFHVDAATETVAVVVLPFPNLPAVAWTQDFAGNRKSFIEPGHLAVPFDFSNEVTTDCNMDHFGVNILCIAPTRPDSLYIYDYKASLLRPTFTMKFTQDPIPWHGYNELPGYYYGDTSVPVQVAENTFSSSDPINYIVDKQTGKGAYCRFVNDYLGDKEIGPWPNFSHGYYIANMEPSQLLEDIEIALPKTSDPVWKQKLTDLKAKLDENQNNYILLAKLKR